MPISFLQKKFAMAAVAAITFPAFCLQAAPLEVVSYSYSKQPDDNYPDPEMTKLIDEEIVPDQDASPYTREATVGWLQNPADPEVPHPAITFDLGEMKYIDEIAINYVLWPGAGVRAPNEVRVSYSMDGSEFLMEEAFTGFDGSDNSPYVIYTRNLPVILERKAARYVRLDFRQGPESGSNLNRSVFHFIDEVSFEGASIDDLNTSASSSIYRAVELEFPTEIGEVYQVQSSPDLENWEDFGPKILGNGDVYQVFSSAKSEDRGFFRVQTRD